MNGEKWRMMIFFHETESINYSDEEVLEMINRFTELYNKDYSEEYFVQCH